MAKKQPGRPSNPKRKSQIATLIKLSPEHRRVLNADFGSYQAGVEELVERYCESLKTKAQP